MSQRGWTRIVAASGFAALAAVAWLAPTRAQDRPARGTAPPAVAASTVQEALIRPVDFRFDGPTPLREVAAYLRRTLGIRVVIDRAALGRLEIDQDAPVQLELEGARLKTALKLLLDQLEMTYAVEPEDNLLILTDRQGSTDPVDQLASELKVVHQEIHDLQDAVDAIGETLGVGLEGPMIQNPTIIEEKPAAPGEEPAEPPARTRPGI